MFEFQDVVSQMKEGQTFLLGDSPDDDINLAAFPLKLEELNNLLTDTNFVFTLCWGQRVGSGLFARYLELKYFHPDTDSNKLMLCIYHKWQGMLWTITGVPRKWQETDGTLKDGEDYLREAIEFAGLRIVEEGYVPMMIGGTGKPNAEFEGVPVNAPIFDMSNVLYLENSVGNLVYEDRKAALREEAKKIEAVEKQYL